MGATGHSISIIAQGSTMRGTLDVTGHVLVEGVVEGSCEIKGMLTVSESGVVRGDSQADVVVIKGRVEGNIEASDRLELHETAVVVGDIVAGKLVIQSGAVVNGSSRVVAPQRTVRALPRPDRLIGSALRRLAASA